MKHEYVDASDLIQTDMRSGNEKKLDAMLDERGANEMGAETAVVLRNIALELMAQLEQDEKTRPASDADMAVYRGIAANYHKDKADLTQQDAQAELPIIRQNKLLADALASCILASGIVRTDIDGLTGPQLLLFAEDLRTEIEALVRDAGRYRWLRDEAWGGNNRSGPHLVAYRPGLMPSAVTELAEDAADTAIDAAMQEKQS